MEQSVAMLIDSFVRRAVDLSLHFGLSIENNWILLRLVHICMSKIDYYSILEMRIGVSTDMSSSYNSMLWKFMAWIVLVF